MTPKTHEAVMLKLESLPVQFIIPREEVEYLRQYIGPERTDLQLYQMIAYNRLVNKICSHCGNMDALLECSDCHLTHYCDTACLDAHLPQHREWCCNVDGQRDKGYLEVVMVSVGENSQFPTSP